MERIKEELLMSSICPSVRLFIWSPVTFLPLNWRDTGLMDGLLEGQGVGRMAVSKELQSAALSLKRMSGVPRGSGPMLLNIVISDIEELSPLSAGLQMASG